MKKASFLRLEIFYFLMMWASNFAHPVTPAFFNALGFSSSMFGISFAAMSVTYFLLSPLWGRLADQRGAVPMMALSLAGYGVAQWLFGLVTTPAALVLVRLLAGAFTCGYQVIAMAYCGNLGDERTRPRLLSIHGAVMAAAAALGYLTGGFIGVASIAWVFRLQAIVLAALGVGVAMLLGEPLESQPAEPLPEATGAPHAVWTLPLALMLLGVMLASFGTTGYENAFNYYITDILAFPTSYNGLIKALTGLTGFAANMLLQLYLARGRDGRRTLIGVLGINVVLLALSLFMPGSGPFIAANVVFTAFNAMVLPLQQALAARGQAGRMGRASGLFNAARSLGMVGGSLFAGFIYAVHPRLPFFCAAVAFAAAGIAAYCQQAAARRQG